MRPGICLLLFACLRFRGGLRLETVGRQWWLLLLARADLTRACPHFGAMDVLDVVVLSTEIFILLGAYS